MFCLLLMVWMGLALPGLKSTWGLSIEICTSLSSNFNSLFRYFRADKLIQLVGQAAEFKFEFKFKTKFESKFKTRKDPAGHLAITPKSC